MVDPARVFVFAGVVILLAATPGPSSVYIITRGLSEGRRAAVLSALGVETGDLVHIAMAALGLSALIATSALALSTLQLLGGAYLVFLGAQAARKSGQRQLPRRAPMAAEGQEPGLWRAFRQGFVVNVLNPKAALFFMAFLPQFVEPARGSATTQILLLGAVFVLVAGAVDMLYAVLSGTVGKWLGQRRAILLGQRYVASAVYMALGAVAVLSGVGFLAS